jgi:hypothetical protein
MIFSYVCSTSIYIFLLLHMSRTAAGASAKKSINNLDKPNQGLDMPTMLVKSMMYYQTSKNMMTGS